VLNVRYAGVLQTIIRHRLLLPDGVDQDIVDGVDREAGYETAVKFSMPEICRYIDMSSLSPPPSKFSAQAVAVTENDLAV
jgi:hypothetical protein